jgi:glycolate oxidase iron-sulfur subunit
VRFVETERLLACVHCGLCLPSCPTYVELGTEADSPRGRIHLMRALEDGRLAPTPEVVRHLDLCLGCRACETACPSGVPYGTLIESARPFVENARPAPARWARRVLCAALTSPRVMRVARAALRPVAGRDAVARLARRTGSAALAYLAALPRGARAPLPARLAPAGRPRGTAAFLPGCVADAAFSRTNLATALLLRKAGVRVLTPSAAGCCGALAEHLGDARRARALAARAAATLAATDADWFVASAAGCGALLRAYAELLPGERAARDVAARSRDALAVLAEVGLPAPVRALDAAVAIHDPCHLLHGQGVRDPVRRLLAALPGVRLVELDEADVCCGSAGTYNLTEPAMARRLVARKLDRIAASGADVVVAANPGCLVQIRSGAILRGLPVRVEHPIDVLAAAHLSDDEAAVR